MCSLGQAPARPTVGRTAREVQQHMCGCMGGCLSQGCARDSHVLGTARAPREDLAHGAASASWCAPLLHELQS